MTEKINKIMRKRVSVNTLPPDFTGKGAFNFQPNIGSVKLSLEKTIAQKIPQKTTCLKVSYFLLNLC